MKVSGNELCYTVCSLPAILNYSYCKLDFQKGLNLIILLFNISFSRHGKKEKQEKQEKQEGQTGLAGQLKKAASKLKSEPVKSGGGKSGGDDLASRPSPEYAPPPSKDHCIQEPGSCIVPFKNCANLALTVVYVPLFSAAELDPPPVP